MLAIDTNVVVRYLVEDDARQTARARELIDRQDVFVLTTVLLEAEWVLRGVYAFSSDRIVAALKAFAGLPHVIVEDPEHLKHALDCASMGLDFADAIHLAGASGRCSALATFDKVFVKTAKTLRSCEVRGL